MNNFQPVVLITGASRGIGFETAKLLVGSGFRVYGGSRTLAATLDNESFVALQLDVVDDSSVRQAVDQIIRIDGRLDVLINAAGYSVFGASEDILEKDLFLQFNTNYFGVVRCVNRVLPIFRAQKSGVIVNIGGMASRFPLPFQAHYSAAKAALSSYSEALSIEVSRYGIRVSLIEPGDVKTTFTDHRVQVLKSGGAYVESHRRVLEVVEQDERSGASPKVVANAIHRIIQNYGAPEYLKVGLWTQRLAVFIIGLLPRSLSRRLIGYYYNV